MLDSVKDQYDEIHVSPFWALLPEYKPENIPDYTKFVSFIFQTIFSEPPYIISESQDFEVLSALKTGGLTLIKPDIRKYLKHESPFDSPYVVMTTKVRGTPRTFYNIVEKELGESLRELSKKYTIVLLGERTVGMSKEYKIHGSNTIYCIYDSLPKDFMVDLTSYDELGINAPDIPIFRRDCNIIANSVATIAIGCGGNFCLASALTNTITYSLYGDGEEVLRVLYRDKKDDTVSVYVDGDAFCKRIREL